MVNEEISRHTTYGTSKAAERKNANGRNWVHITESFGDGMEMEISRLS